MASSSSPSHIVERHEADVRLVTAAAARLVAAGVDQEASEPGVQATVVAEPRKISPGAHQCVLDGVLGTTAVVQDQGGGGVQAVEPGCGQCRERIVVSPDAA